MAENILALALLNGIAEKNAGDSGNSRSKQSVFFSRVPLTAFDHVNHIDIDHESASIFGIDHFSIGFFDVINVRKQTDKQTIEQTYTTRVCDTMTVPVPVPVLIWHINYCYANEAIANGLSAVSLILRPKSDLIELNHNDVQ